MVIMSCAAKTADGTPCKKKGPFCKTHAYMQEYTPEMIEQCTLCKGCRKMKFTGEYSNCDACRGRGEINRKEAKANIVLCAHEDCKSKKSKANKYCGYHQLDIFIDATEELGLKCCKNVTRKCRSQLPKDGKSSCELCLAKEREKDHAKRGTIVITETEKQCSNCSKMCPLDHFNGLHNDTKTCQSCRDYFKKMDEKRDKEHVNELARKNEKKPERVEVKKRWNEENHERVALANLNYRARQIELDQEAYLNHKAEIAKIWRHKNPEKMQERNHCKINSIDEQYGVCKSTARSKGLDFELPFEFYKTIVTTPCYYCGIIQEKGFNGIDRTDSTKGYVPDNVLPSCQMCNFMKGSVPPNTFIHHVEQILTHQGIIQGRRFETKDTRRVSYSEYKNRAEQKEREFTLTEEMFEQEIMKDCYLCGKSNSDSHSNGLDRFDNAQGYTDENVLSCCGNCNYLKNNYLYEDVLEKCERIYANKPAEIEINPVVRVNKTKEQKAEEARIRKQKSREKQRAEMGDEEFRKRRAKEIAEDRKKRAK